MTHPNFVMFYVENPPASIQFYADLLGQAPVESSPNFGLFVLPSGLKLGLWSREAAVPAGAGKPGGAELAFTAADAEAVDAVFSTWSSLGLTILQEPMDMEFGRTFVAIDPDGHRLRVYAPALD